MGCSIDRSSIEAMMVSEKLGNDNQVIQQIKVVHEDEELLKL